MESLGGNLRNVREQFGDGRLFAHEDGEIFEVDGVEFVCDYQVGSTASRFFIIKQVSHVRDYIDLCRRFQGGRILELGVAEGGSAALTALEARPSRLVALDIAPEPVAALDAFIQARGLEETVRQYAGVDQGDAGRLWSIVDVEFGGESLDLIVDDASHDLALTRSSFDALFPRVRPGGAFVVEDWAADHVWRQGVVDALRAMDPEDRSAAFREAQASPDAPEDRAPLSDLVMELLITNALRPDVVASCDVNQYRVVVERGPAELDPSSFRLADLYTDYFGYLTDRRPRR